MLEISKILWMSILYIYILSIPFSAFIVANSLYGFDEEIQEEYNRLNTSTKCIINIGRMIGTLIYFICSPVIMFKYLSKV